MDQQQQLEEMLIAPQSETESRSLVDQIKAKHSSPMKKKKKVIIVGAGFGGLFALKHCLEEGMEATIVEANPYVGGVWDPRSGAVLKTTECVSSKHFMGASDFPMDDSYPEFPMGHDVLRYIHSYIDRFDLLKHIQLSCPVQSIDRIEERGVWRVALKDANLESDFVILGTGTHGTPSMPQEWAAFRSSPQALVAGTHVLHGADYQRQSAFLQKSLESNRHQRILIVGCSDSACDIANDLFYTKGATNMVMTSRRGAWFQDKSVGFGRPSDMYYSFLVDFFKRLLGRHRLESWIVGPFLIAAMEKFWGKAGLGVKEWKPEGNYLSSAYVKSRSILSLLNNGSVKPVRTAVPHSEDGTVSLFNSEGVELERTKFDLVIVCSGYKFSPGDHIGLQDPAWVHPENLYNMTFCHSHPSLAVVGNVRPYVTSIVTMSEFQAWSIAHAFAHDTLPSKEKRQEAIKTDEKKHRECFPLEHERLPFLVDPYDFVRQVATEVGTSNWWEGLPLWQQLRVFFMAWTPAVYRLQAANKGKRELAKGHIVKTYTHHRASRGIEHDSKGVVRCFLFLAMLFVCLIVCFMNKLRHYYYY